MQKHKGTQTKLTFLTFVFAVIGITASYVLAFFGREPLESLAITMFSGAVVTIGIRGGKRAYDNKVERTCDGNNNVDSGDNSGIVWYVGDSND